MERAEEVPFLKRHPYILLSKDLHFQQGATGPENPPGRPWRKVQPRRGAGAKFQIHPGRQYLRLVLLADLPGTLQVPAGFCLGCHTLISRLTVTRL